MKSIKIIGVLLVTAIASGYMLNELIKKAGMDSLFDSDLFAEDIEDDQY